jgi:hypothetical protein
MSREGIGPGFSLLPNLTHVFSVFVIFVFFLIAKFLLHDNTFLHQILFAFWAMLVQLDD